MYFTKQGLIKFNKNKSIHDLENLFLKLGYEVEDIKKNEHNKGFLKLGKIISFEKIKESDKLHLCQVQVLKENEIRQIVCGAPNIKANMGVVIATSGAKIGNATIAKRKVMGYESDGMICSLKELGFDISVIPENFQEGIWLFDVHELNEENEALLTDTIYDLSITANRPDVMSYFGMLQDLKALSLDIVVDFKTNNNELQLIKSPLIAPPELVNQYINIHAFNVKIYDSNLKMQLFLMKNHIKPVNNIVDLTNFLMLKWGIPIHAFDADKIDGQLKVCLDKGKIIALDGHEYDLKEPKLVIKDDQKIVALAGIIGLENSKITKNTKNIIFEIANFNPHYIRQSRHILPYKTEAEKRFEKKVDQDKLKYIIADFKKYFNEKIVVNQYGMQNNSATYELTISKINQLLGTGNNYLKADIIKDLQKLDYYVEQDGDKISCIPPARKIIENSSEIIADLSRLINLNNLREVNLPIANRPIDKINLIKSELMQNGFNEILTYSLVQKANSQKSVELSHPLSEEHKFYRNEITTSLIHNLKYNLHYSDRRNILTYEIGTCYESINEPVTKIAFLCHNDQCQNKLIFLEQKLKNQAKSSSVDFKEAQKYNIKNLKKIYTLEMTLQDFVKAYQYEN